MYIYWFKTVCCIQEWLLSLVFILLKFEPILTIAMPPLSNQSVALQYQGQIQDLWKGGSDV